MAKERQREAIKEAAKLHLFRQVKVRHYDNTPSRILPLILLITLFLSTACSTQISGLGSVGAIGPQGTIGPQPLEGSPPDDLIVIESSGNLAVQEYELSGFDRIEINSLLDVDIYQGESFKIVTQVKEDAMPFLQVSVDGNTLQIGLDPTQTYHTANVTLKAEVTLPELNRLVVVGIGKATLHDFECTEKLDILVAGISSVHGEVSGCDLNLRASNLSKAALSGSAENVSIDVKKLSEVDLSLLKAVSLELDVDSNSKVTQ